MFISNHIQEGRKIFDVVIEGVTQVRDSIGQPFDSAVEIILETKGKIVVTGIGKSGIIAHKIAATLASTGTPSIFLNAGEALHGDLGVIAPDDVVLMLSNSAATTELCQMLPSIREIGAKTIGLFGRCDTPLAHACDVVLEVSIPREACPLGLAPMSSSTAALVYGDALAGSLMKARGFKPEDFAVYHPGGSLGRRLLLRVRDVMHSFSEGTGPVVYPSDTVKNALLAMTEWNLGGVVIAEANCIKGVFTDGDLRRRITEGCSLEIGIGDVMTKNPICVTDSMRLSEALELMESKSRKVYFLPVKNNQDHLCGFLRMHDILGSS